jgi:hypothetical protein
MAENWSRSETQWGEGQPLGGGAWCKRNLTHVIIWDDFFSIIGARSGGVSSTSAPPTHAPPLSRNTHPPNLLANRDQKPLVWFIFQEPNTHILPLKSISGYKKLTQVLIENL